MTPTTTWTDRPWEMPFWKPAPGKEFILLYLAMIHLMALVGFILFPLPSLPVLLIAIAGVMIGGFGTTVCYHRAISHRTLKLNPVLEHVLIFWTMFNGSGAPASWSAYHRRHHARSDQDEDVSSPAHGGFWWAHIRWLYQSERADVKRWAPDLDTPVYRFWRAVEVPVILLSLFAGVYWGWEGFFWIGAIRLVYSLHMQCLVNSIMHLGAKVGDSDSSRNIWWLGPFQMTAWGENWHRNHHSFSNSAQFGLKWYQIDIGWYAILAFEKLGLATNVKRPKVLKRTVNPSDDIQQAV